MILFFRWTQFFILTHSKKPHTVVVNFLEKRLVQLILDKFKKSSFYYSVLKLFTGFATAAFIAWKLTVIKAIRIAEIPAAKKIHQLI